MLANATLPHQIKHHSEMLADTLRLQSYAKAIGQIVKPEDCVVDIGTGTGILASFAGLVTNGPVYALEYFKETSEFAKASLKSSRNVHVVNSTSFGRPIDAKPQVVVTETIGGVGPEENIVEICYEFKKRYPSIENFIPANLSVYAVPVRSHKIAQKKKETISPFNQAANSGIDFSWALSAIEQKYCKTLLGDDLSDAVATASATLLASYELGETGRSEFTKDISQGIEDADGVHLYFVAELSPEVSLSSSCAAALTHWKHRYVCKPQGHKHLTVQYVRNQQNWRFIWK